MGVGGSYASEWLEKRAQEEEIGGDRSLGVLGVVDALRLESTPSVCKRNQVMRVMWGKSGERGMEEWMD